MEEIFKDLNSAIGALKEVPGWALFGLLTAAGTISMAVLQVFKDLTPIRRWYQRHWIRRWIERRAESFNERLRSSKGSKRELAPVHPQRASDVLLELATGGDERALFELAIEQLVAQMNAAAQAALDYPKHYRDLLLVLSEGADIADAALVVRGRKGIPQAYLDSRNRVGNRIQRNLDGVQIALGSRWRFWMHSTAIVLSIIIIDTALYYAVGGFKPAAMIGGAVIGIVGGYLAPVTRDLVAALQSLRKG